ncbi:MAG: histidine phosphatase family protein [Gammaproteobacteria bacterium]|nr:histidine phosphatase family protein [Gammaproteobacteria bacterium]
MELILVRHGSQQPDERGDGDPALSETGTREARQVADFLARAAVDAIYTSPLRRAVETAAPLARALALRPIVCDGVVEYHPDAIDHAALKHFKAENYAAAKAALANFGNQADLELFRIRVVDTVESIIADHPDECVAVFCHASVVNAWACSVLGLPSRPFINVAHGSVSRFLCRSANASFVASLNETQHLLPDA